MTELLVLIQFVQFSKSYVTQVANMGFQTQMCNILVFFQHPFGSKTFFTNITFMRLDMSIFKVMVKIVFHGKSFGAILTLQMRFSMHNSFVIFDGVFGMSQVPANWPLGVFLGIASVQFSKSFVAQITNIGFQTMTPWTLIM